MTGGAGFSSDMSRRDNTNRNFLKNAKKWKERPSMQRHGPDALIHINPTIHPTERAKTSPSRKYEFLQSRTFVLLLIVLSIFLASLIIHYLF
ncbi:MAG: hypothetical protein U0V54_12460 [Saprospiraceae bacterium]|nr:hypothetical protein [Saprospiraceae bacterium]